MRISRLALFNIKKHKTECVSLFFLVLLCMTLLASAVSGISGINGIVDNAFEKTGSVRNYIFMKDSDYKEIYTEFFENDPRITSFRGTDMAYSESAKYIDRDGNEKSQIMAFISQEHNSAIEKLVTDSEYTPSEHFILMPYYAKDTLKYKVGDTFNMLFNEKVYPFEVAGFYETGHFSDSSTLKFIVSPADMTMMQNVLGKYRFIGFETAAPEDAEKFIKDILDFADENSVGGEAMNISAMSFSQVKESSTSVTKLLMGLMIAMSAVVFISIAFMIRFRIKNDIDEQIVSIGTLEALGYKSGEISLSYVIEYTVITLPAVICGLLLSLLTAPLLLRVGEIMTGHHGAKPQIGIVPVILGAAAVGFSMLISFTRARRIRKIPPVVAFRKGVENHCHKKNRLPLEKTKTNIHVRLAAKDFFADMKTNIGMSACISAAAAALMVCFVISDFMGSGIHALAPLMALDISDVGVVTVVGTDEQALKDEIAGMEDVKKVRLSNVYPNDSVKAENNDVFSVLAYESYDDAENIRPSEGRCPKHDNEVMIKKNAAKSMDKKVGDTLTLRVGKIQADYVICGVTSSFMQVGDTCYMTDAGYKRLVPSYRPAQLDIFLKKGTDRTEFKKVLFEKYGTPSGNDAGGGDLEERIRREADSKIGAMLEMYGVNSLDYAIRIGDRTISGNSSAFKIKSNVSLTELVENMLANFIKAFSVGTGIFMVISVFTITIIVFLVIHSAVRKQRTRLGVLKGMGYTSSELMLQTSLKLLPTLIFSVVVGSIAGIALGRFIYSQIGVLPVMTAKVVVIAAAVVLFGFAVAFFSAGKIKNISVYELMQE